MAIKLNRLALACAESLGQAAGGFRMNLGATIGTRYESFGNRQDLDESIALYRITIDERDCTDGFLRNAVCNLLPNLAHRFDITGEEGDLEEAESLAQKELQSTSPENRLYASHLHHLASIFRRRYGLHHRAEDLTNSISALNLSLATKHMYHSRGDRLVDLAKILLIRVKDIERTTKDLDYANTLLREALGLREPGHPRRHEALNALAEVYVHRFEHTGTSADLDEAFRIQSESVNDIPLGHVYRARALFGLARLYLLHGTSRFSIEKALDLSIEAVKDNNGTVQLLLMSALDALSSLEVTAQCPSFGADNRARLLEFYKHVIELIPRVAYFGLDLESRLRVLARADSIATAAATHAIALGQVEVAIEVLEQGRGVFWAQALRLRTPLDGLPPELANDLKSAAQRLEARTRKVAVDALHTKAAVEEEALKLRQLSNEFETLISRARAHPGHERFLLADEYSTLSVVAKDGPVVIFLSGKGRSSAVVLRSSESPRVVDMPNVIPDELLKHGTMLRDAHKDYRQEGIDASPMRNDMDPELDRLGIAAQRTTYRLVRGLSDLWDQVMWPVIEALGLPVSSLLYPNYTILNPHLACSRAGQTASLALPNWSLLSAASPCGHII
jgi:hypothetical protein